MNKIIEKSIFACLSLSLLVSCGQTSISDSSFSSFDSSSSNSSSNNQISNTTSTSSSSTIEDNGMSLFMYGDLYKDGMRTIYAKMDNYQNLGKTVRWESSDDSIVSVSSVSIDEGDEEPYLAESLLTGRNYGTATITAYLEEDETIRASLEITIKEGQAMSESLFKSFSQSVKFTFVEENLSYDEDYTETVDETYDITTIFEENYDPNSTTQGYYDLDNYTDAYQLTSVDRKTNTAKEYKYVRSNGNQVAKERIGLNNNIDYELLKNSEENTIKFDNSYYINPFGQSYDGTYEDWKTFDDGKTYHFTGSYIQATYICTSLLLEDISPDDLWFTIDNNTYTFNVAIDPYNQDKIDSIKYGKRVTGTISEIGSATIDHIKPYNHEAYHDDIQEAIDNMAKLKNYKVSYDVTYPTASDSFNYTYTYTEDTIDTIVSNSTGIVSHTGIHKKDDGTYYAYEYNETNKTLTLTKSYSTQWEGGEGENKIVRYPTFAFASEIFADQVDGYYTSRSDNGVFINYCVYAPSSFSYYTFDNEGSIKLDGNGYISNIKTKITALDEDVEFFATFSDFNNASISLDFNNIIIPSNPTSWEEESTYIASQLDDYNMKKYLPYMYIKPGWWDCGFVKSISTTNAYLYSHPFDTEEELEAFIVEYGELLVENGYTKTEELDTNNNNGIIYIKDDVKVSIGKELNWNNIETLATKIFVYASDLTPNSSYD